MGLKPHQPPSRIKAVNEFTDRMKNTLEEAKSALDKVKDDMARYYNQHRSSAPSFAPGNKVYLDSSDIQTTCLSITAALVPTESNTLLDTLPTT